MVSTLHQLTTYLTLKVFVLSSVTSSHSLNLNHHNLNLNHHSQLNNYHVPQQQHLQSQHINFKLQGNNSSYSSFLNTSSPLNVPPSHPNLPNSPAGESIALSPPGQEQHTNRIYQQGSTLAVVSFVTLTKELTYCVVYDIDKDRDIVLILFKLYYESILHINIDDMIRLIDTCREVDMKRNPSQYHPPSLSVPTTATGRSFVTSSASRSDSGSISGIMIGNFTDMWTGMVPGTKWCGLGDSASNYFDLGSKGIVDSCCRAHDLCPIRLRPFRRGYGLGYNLSIYTKSYCTCDDSFYHCLKSTNSTMADMIGNFYFNFMKFGCLEPINNSVDFSLSKKSFHDGPSLDTSYSGIKKSMKSLKEVKLRVNYTRNLRY